MYTWYWRIELEIILASSETELHDIVYLCLRCWDFSQMSMIQLAMLIDS